jgi:hypothetical protein
VPKAVGGGGTPRTPSHRGWPLNVSNGNGFNKRTRTTATMPFTRNLQLARDAMSHEQQQQQRGCSSCSKPPIPYHLCDAVRVAAIGGKPPLPVQEKDAQQAQTARRGRGRADGTEAEGQGSGKRLPCSTFDVACERPTCQSRSGCGTACRATPRSDQAKSEGKGREEKRGGTTDDGGGTEACRAHAHTP